MKKENNICVLTQTATDISDYYKDFFRGYDLYFVTFKKENSNAVDFLPNSTWSDGRNRLWEEVRGKYNYYLFIDDDLIFNKAKHAKIALLQRIRQKLDKGNLVNSYEKCSSNFFIGRLNHWLKYYKPEVLTVKNLNNLCAHSLDANALSHNQYVRRVGWFDAQFTLLSNYAAEHLLPYDTSFSGWASAQILIYLLSYNVFGEKAISVTDIAVNNIFHTGAYVENYKSNLDCKQMIECLDKLGIESKTKLFDTKTNHVNLFYGKENILNKLIDKTLNVNYYEVFRTSSMFKLKEIMANNNLDF